MIMQAWKTVVLLALAGLLLAMSDQRVSGGPLRAFPEELEHVARDYRIRIYNTFRQNREEYDRRRLALERLYQAWAAAEQTPSQEQAIGRWLREGIRRSTPGSIQPLASPPTLDRTAREAARPASPDVAPHAGPVQPELKTAALPDVETVPSLEKGTVPPVVMRRQLADESTIAPPALPRRSTAPAEIEVPVQSLARLTTTPGLLDATPAPQTPVERAKINLVELQARINGFNRSIRTLENGWAERSRWTAAELAAELASFEETLALRPNIDLYVNLLGESEREATGAPVATDETVRLFAKRLAAARAEVVSAGFQGTEADRRRELEILAALSRRLAERARDAQARSD